jgi:hypothetical protein
MKELVEKIVRTLVDFPEEVAVQEIEGTSMNILEIKVELTRFCGHPNLLGGGVHDAENKTTLCA